MTDFLTKAERSRRMSLIRGKDTAPERLVRCGLHREGFRFRLHVGELPGTPDIVLPRYGAVVFVHGCFWHGHSCQRPAVLTDYWIKKIDDNRRRDAKVRRALRQLGYRVFVVWQCQLRNKNKRAATIGRLAARLRAFEPSAS